MKPVKGDKASHSRIKSFFFQEYPERWAELAAILSKTAVLKGAFDRYVEAKKIKKGTAEVDRRFWRRSSAGGTCWPETSLCAMRP